MYQIVILPHFHRQLKLYSKKYYNLKDDLISTLRKFDKRQSIPLGGGVYKIRLKSSDLPRGKSNSFRLIILLAETDKLLAPVAIYFKGRKANITKKELNQHLEIILYELEAK